MRAINLQSALSRQKQRERSNSWKKANRDTVNAQQQRHRAANPEQTRAYGRAAYARDPKGQQAKTEDWVKRNPERKRKHRRDNYARNPELAKLRVMQWRAANPERVKEYKATNRARRQNPDAKIESFCAEQIAGRDSWICHICNESIPRGARPQTKAYRTIDHLIPLSLKGDHTRANVKIAHMVCNATRNNRDRSYLEAA